MRPIYTSEAAVGHPKPAPPDAVCSQCTAVGRPWRFYRAPGRRMLCSACNERRLGASAGVGESERSEP
jgi:hypothetical protein